MTISNRNCFVCMFSPLFLYGYTQLSISWIIKCKPSAIKIPLSGNEMKFYGYWIAMPHSNSKFYELYCKKRHKNVKCKYNAHIYIINLQHNMFLRDAGKETIYRDFWVMGDMFVLLKISTIFYYFPYLSYLFLFFLFFIIIIFLMY